MMLSSHFPSTRSILHILLLRSWINMHAIDARGIITMMASPEQAGHCLTIQELPTYSMCQNIPPFSINFHTKEAMSLVSFISLPFPTTIDAVFSMPTHMYLFPKALIEWAWSFAEDCLRNFPSLRHTGTTTIFTASTSHGPRAGHKNCFTENVLADAWDCRSPGRLVLTCCWLRPLFFLASRWMIRAC